MFMRKARDVRNMMCLSLIQFIDFFRIKCRYRLIWERGAHSSRQNVLASQVISSSMTERKLVILRCQTSNAWCVSSAIADWLIAVCHSNSVTRYSVRGKKGEMKTQKNNHKLSIAGSSQSFVKKAFRPRPKLSVNELVKWVIGTPPQSATRWAFLLCRSVISFDYLFYQ